MKPKPKSKTKVGRGQSARTKQLKVLVSRRAATRVGRASRLPVQVARSRSDKPSTVLVSGSVVGRGSRRAVTKIGPVYKLATALPVVTPTEIIEELRSEIQIYAESYRETDGVLRNMDAIWTIACLERAIVLLNAQQTPGGTRSPSPTSNWISVKDRLPESANTVIISSPQYISGVWFGWYGKDKPLKGVKPRWHGVVGDLPPVTHWMHLPNPPTK